MAVDDSHDNIGQFTAESVKGRSSEKMDFFLIKKMGGLQALVFICSERCTEGETNFLNDLRILLVSVLLC